MSHIYFKMFLAILVLCFIEAIREMMKYSADIQDHRHGSDHSQHLDVEMQQHMRLFRAQRNFYISGFSLFLYFILQRLMTLISNLARTQAECEAAMKQAKSASAAAEQLMSGDSGISDPKLKEEMKKLREENKKVLAEKEAALKQAESVSREYDRLMDELSVLQKEKGQTADKKCD